MTPEQIADLARTLHFDRVTVDDGRVFVLRYVDTSGADKPHKVVSDEYVEIADDLKSVGLEFVEPNVEHDCISGDVIEIPPEPQS